MDMLISFCISGSLALVGSSALSLSLTSMSLAVADETAFIIFGIRPVGIFLLAALCKTFLKNLSLACTSSVWGAVEKASSVSRSKFVQSAFLKLMYVFLSDFICFMAVDMLMRIGRWSDERVVSVDQLHEGRIPV